MPLNNSVDHYEHFFMKTKLSHATYLSIILLTFSSCQREEKKEDRAIDRLMQESEGSFPETMQKTERLEQEVKKINVQIKQDSEQRVNQINEELKKKKK